MVRAIRVMAVLLAGAVVPASGQTAGPITGQTVRPPINESMYGPDLYRMYCAACHGRDGTGKGPAASALKTAPPDLTVLARRQSGVFPKHDVEAIIRGSRSVAAHGSAEMPVWGPIFHALDPRDARVQGRITNLVSYLASIQQR